MNKSNNYEDELQRLVYLALDYEISGQTALAEETLQKALALKRRHETTRLLAVQK